MERQEICDYFSKIMENEKDLSVAMAAVRTLMKFLEHFESETVVELDYSFRNAIDAMKSLDYPIVSIESGSELFIRYITLTNLDSPSFAECKRIMLKRGETFYNEMINARGKITKLASRFITLGCRILTHSKSRVVLQTMKEVAANNHTFHVYVTHSAPDNSGIEMWKDLKKSGVSCTLILDSEVGYVMEKVDIVMVGAEGVTENGGVINKIGTYTLAICAKQYGKPFYVLTESFKLSRIFIQRQSDLPVEFKYNSITRMKDLQRKHPLVDYTPPPYIHLLFTDVGIKTPSAIPDELIKLYT